MNNKTTKGRIGSVPMPSPINIVNDPWPKYPVEKRTAPNNATTLFSKIIFRSLYRNNDVIQKKNTPTA